MAVTVQLKDFDVKASPVPTDIVYLANSADSFNEVQSTIAEVIAAYPALSSIALLTTAADEMIYTTASNVYAVAPLTAFGRTVVALSAATTVPSAGVLAGWDTNKNLRANSFLPAFVTTVTAAGTTTLTVASAGIQEFTGSTTQTIVMPVTSTLIAGQGYTIINNSSGALTVNSSGGNLIQTMGANTQLNLICVLITGTTAASWQSSYTTDAFPLSVANGGTGVTSLPVTASASAFAAWDTNVNIPANNFLSGFATTVSAAGTTTLTVASAYNQEITGSTTQTVQMPVASTLVAGTSFKIINNSSGSVTINSSGGNSILVMAANTTAFVTLVLNSGTTAASWNASYVFDNGAGVLSITGTANQVIASASTGAVILSLPQNIGTGSSPTFASMTLTNPHIAGAGGLVSFQVLTSGTGATYTKPAGITSIFVECQAGGGAGGGAAGAASSTAAGGGGGEGGYCSLWVASAASTYTYTVGAGGTAGTAGNVGGNAGGNSTFSASSLSAIGGNGGNGAASALNTASGSAAGIYGGISTNGTVNKRGAAGDGGFVALGNGCSGSGGGYGGGPGRSTDGAGLDAVTGYGGGGGGAFATTTNRAGGVGFQGVIIVWEFA